MRENNVKTGATIKNNVYNLLMTGQVVPDQIAGIRLVRGSV